jgi:hypothetical protein
MPFSAAAFTRANHSMRAGLLTEAPRRLVNLTGQSTTQMKVLTVNP